MTDWNTWSRIVDAAQDPQYRDAVQQFLAQAELSADLPAALDEKLLAPRRAAGATGEQCAFLFSNLGFAALVAGTRDAADFAVGCGRQAKQLGPNSPDLALRCHFLFSKSALMVAVLSGRPNVGWDDAAAVCTAYLSAIEQNLEILPDQPLESNVMAAYSFAAQTLARVDRNRAVGHFAGALGELVDQALGLADRLPPTLASRMWAGVIPGIAADRYFRQVGAVAQCALQPRDPSSDHARKGMAWADEVIARSRPGPELGPIMQTRAKLLLQSGRYDQAIEQADALERLSDATCQTLARLVRARYCLDQGDPDSASGVLAQIATTAETGLVHWQDAWLGDAGEDNWTSRSGGLPLFELDQETWRLQAAAMANRGDLPGFIGAAGLATGFLADALLRDRSGWADHSGSGTAVEHTEPMAVLDEVFDLLADGTALVQVVRTGAGILTWVARLEDGVVRQEISPGRPDSHKLGEAHGAWSRALFDHRQRDGGTAGTRADCIGAYAGLMDEVGRTWGALLGELVDDGISQCVFIGDDLVDIPLHAIGIGAGGQRLIDRVPVSYLPSLSALRACVARRQVDAGRRHGLGLHCLAAAGPDAVEALADVLQARPIMISDVSGPSARVSAAGAEVLHVDARLTHNPQMPLQSVLGMGSLDLPVARLVAELELPQCDLVSGFACESVLPTMLRAPGIDLSTVFLASGARCVLASTWQADDDLANEMTRLFFRHWVDGLAPSVAFQRALRAVRTARPSLEDFEWACLRLVGGP